MANTNPLVKVTVAGAPEFEVQTRQSDLLRYETTARKHGWGLLGNDDKFSTVQWLSFLAWSAAKRTGALPETMTWETFSAEVEDVELVGGESPDPTPGVLEPDN